MGILRTAGALVLAALSAAPAAPPRDFDLQGHRGARGLAPENTLAAFARALSIGVTTLELDTALTRDGHVVVSHDPTLNPDLTRDAEGRWLGGPGPAIFSLPLAEVQRYDVGRLRPGTAYATRFASAAPADGQRIPKLADVFALARRANNPTVRFNVETKIDPRHPGLTPTPEAFADAVIAAVRGEGMASRTTVQSFDWRTLRHVRKVAPEIRTVCLTVQNPGDDNVQTGQPGPSPLLGGLDVDDFGGSVPRLVQAAGCAVWSPHARSVTPALVAEARGLGLKVVPWTVNETGDMEALIAAGVDGIITDYPDRLRTVALRRGLAVPAPTPVQP
ncbi:MAG TPA: glycerophosphodiester phosphodiesterase [Vicinamibacteria bacterium]|nr:glycerophosphodiester phosphodiesterase [Vicinamibacteria bacterium]